MSVQQSEIVKIPLYPASGISSTQNGYWKLFGILQRGWVNLWNNGDESTSENLYNYKNTQYYGEVLVGTPPQKFRVLFDTGSTDTWLPSRKCWFLDIACWFIRFYDSSKSSTYQQNGTYFEVDYLDSIYHGFWSMDTLQINSLVIRNQAFAEVTDVFSSSFFHNKYDGIIGMSCGKVSEYGNIPVFPNILTQGMKMAPIFSFYLSRKDGAVVGGEMVLGGVNTEYFTGDFESLPVVLKDHWAIEMKSLRINGVEYCNKTCLGLIDTGTSMIVGSSELVHKINSRLGATSSKDGEYVFDCSNIDKLPPIEFVFKRRKYVLEAKDYVVKDSNWFFTQCVSPIASGDDIHPRFWVLGDVFMRHFYTVFDFGKREIRLADVNDG